MNTNYIYIFSLKVQLLFTIYVNKKVTKSFPKTPKNRIIRLVTINSLVIFKRFIYAPKLPNKIDD